MSIYRYFSTVAAVLGVALTITSQLPAQDPLQWQAANSARSEHGKVCAEIDVADASGSAPLVGKSRRPFGFSVAATQDLEIRVHLGALPADEHLLSVRFLTPKGNLYQSIDVPLSRLPQRGPSTRHLPGYARPLEVQHIETGSKKAYAAVRLPLAGTQVVSSSLYGSWTVEAHLDESTEACAMRQFLLTP